MFVYIGIANYILFTTCARDNVRVCVRACVFACVRTYVWHCLCICEYIVACACFNLLQAYVRVYLRVGVRFGDDCMVSV